MQYPLSICRIMATELDNQLLSTIQSMSSSQMSNCRNVDSQRRRNQNCRQEDLCQLSPSVGEDGVALAAAVDSFGGHDELHTSWQVVAATRSKSSAPSSALFTTPTDYGFQNLIIYHPFDFANDCFLDLVSHLPDMSVRSISSLACNAAASERSLRISIPAVHTAARTAVSGGTHRR